MASFSKNEIRAMALLNVGYASEIMGLSSNKLSMAWANGHPLGDSGYSIGSIQIDLGKRGTLKDPQSAAVLEIGSSLEEKNKDGQMLLVEGLIEAYRYWRKNQGTPINETEAAKLHRSLVSTGHQMDKEQTRLLTTDERQRFDAFLTSAEGRKVIWGHDVKQLDKMLKHAEDVMVSRTFKALGAGDHGRADQVSLLTSSMKLYNQGGEGKAGPAMHLLEKMHQQDMSIAQVKQFTGHWIGKPSDYLEVGYNNAQNGAKLYHRISESGTPVAQWLKEIGQVDLTVMPESDFKLDARFQVLERLFRDPVNGERFVHALELGRPMRMNVPKGLNDGTESVVGIDRQGVMYTHGVDGAGYREFRAGAWRFNPDKEDEARALSANTPSKPHSHAGHAHPAAHDALTVEHKIALVVRFLEETQPAGQQHVYQERLAQIANQNEMVITEAYPDYFPRVEVEASRSLTV